MVDNLSHHFQFRNQFPYQSQNHSRLAPKRLVVLFGRPQKPRSSCQTTVIKKNSWNANEASIAQSNAVPSQPEVDEQPDDVSASAIPIQRPEAREDDESAEEGEEAEGEREFEDAL
jgi:hypothetical protein